MSRAGSGRGTAPAGMLRWMISPPRPPRGSRPDPREGTEVRGGVRGPCASREAVRARRAIHDFENAHLAVDGAPPALLGPCIPPAEPVDFFARPRGSVLLVVSKSRAAGMAPRTGECRTGGHEPCARAAPAGEHPEGQEVLLQGEGVQEAHHAQGHAVQEGQGLSVRPGEASVRPQAVGVWGPGARAAREPTRQTRRAYAPSLRRAGPRRLADALWPCTCLQTKPVFHKKAKTTKKIVLRLTCSVCKFQALKPIKVGAADVASGSIVGASASTPGPLTWPSCSCPAAVQAFRDRWADEEGQGRVNGRSPNLCRQLLWVFGSASLLVWGHRLGGSRRRHGRVWSSCWLSP